MNRCVAPIKSSDYYRIAFNSIDEGFFVLEKVATGQSERINFRYVLTNSMFERITGLADIIGKTVLAVVPNLNDRPLQIFENVIETGKPIRFEQYEETINRWFSSYAFPIDDPKLKRVAIIFSDISDRKKTEMILHESTEREKLLLKLSDVLRPLSDPIEICNAVTRAAMDYFGADRCYYSEIVDDHIIIRLDAIHSDPPSVADTYPLSSFPIHKSMIEAGLPFSVSDMHATEMVDEELKQLCIQKKVISLLDVPVIKNGKPVGILCIAQGIPRNWTSKEAELAVEISDRAWAAVERAKAEEALRKSNKALEESIEMKDEFLSLISHELRTPLTVIISAIQMLNSLSWNGVSEKVPAYFATIRNNSNRQLKLVNNILDITRINAGRYGVNLKNSDIVDLTNFIIESIRPYAERKKIEISFSFSVAELIIGIDQEKYERILLNLLSNAIKYTPKGGAVSVKLSRKIISKKAVVCIQVCDNGVGISSDKYSYIFERFGKVDSTLSRQAEGTGIGLHLTRMFVELLGGEIKINSKIGAGSTFTVLLPAKKVQETHYDKMAGDTADSRIIQLTDIEFSDVYFDKKG